MNDREINTRIAELRGWWFKPSREHQCQWVDPTGDRMLLPAYTTDLNAIQAAVLAMPQDWQDRFTIELTRLCGSHKLAVNAPADKRARAFLLTSAHQSQQTDNDERH